EPHLAAAPELEAARLVFQFALAGLHPKQVRARFLKAIVTVRLFNSARADGEDVPQQTARHRRRIDEGQVVRRWLSGWCRNCRHDEFINYLCSACPCLRPG